MFALGLLVFEKMRFLIKHVFFVHEILKEKVFAGNIFQIVSAKYT